MTEDAKQEQAKPTVAKIARRKEIAAVIKLWQAADRDGDDVPAKRGRKRVRA